MFLLNTCFFKNVLFYFSSYAHSLLISNCKFLSMFSLSDWFFQKFLTLFSWFIESLLFWYFVCVFVFPIRFKIKVFLKDHWCIVVIASLRLAIILIYGFTNCPPKVSLYSFNKHKLSTSRVLGCCLECSVSLIFQRFIIAFFLFLPFSFFILKSLVMVTVVDYHVLFFLHSFFFLHFSNFYWHYSSSLILSLAVYSLLCFWFLAFPFDFS